MLLTFSLHIKDSLTSFRDFDKEGLALLAYRTYKDNGGGVFLTKRLESSDPVKRGFWLWRDTSGGGHWEEIKSKRRTVGCGQEHSNHYIVIEVEDSVAAEKKDSWKESVEAFEKIAAFHGRKITSGHSWPHPTGTWGMSMCVDGWKIWEATENAGDPKTIIDGLWLNNLVSIATSKEVLRWESRDYMKKPKGKRR